MGSPELRRQIRYASESRRHLAIGLLLADWCCAGRANPRGWAGTAGGRDTRWLVPLGGHQVHKLVKFRTRAMVEKGAVESLKPPINAERGCSSVPSASIGVHRRFPTSAV